MSRRRGLRAMTGLALVAALAGPASVTAQAVVTRVVNGEDAGPLVGALVHLLDASGAVTRSALANERGQVLFTGLVAGRYALRAEMIGMATTETPPFDLGTGASMQKEIVLDPHPIELEGLEVAARERCRVTPGEGALTARVWDEARKALTAAAFTDQEGLYRYRTTMYERDLELGTGLVRREEQTHREGTLRTPFESRPAEELVERGFVQAAGGETLYFGPDAGVLLSDQFLGSHCFGVRAGEVGEESSELLGLTFEPGPGRRHLADIAGTLWLDPATSELRWIEYRYVNLDPEVTSDRVGGRVEFRRMPDGGWIVPRWWIRMPSMGVQTDVQGRLRRFVAGFRESGGVVTDVTERGGRRLVGASQTGGIEGLVLDSLGLPRSGIIVRVLGSSQAVFTNGDGRFGITGLVAGTYQVRFTDPRLESYGYVPAPLTQRVVRGEMAYLEHQVPSARVALAGLCRQATAAEPDRGGLPPDAHGDGVLVGWVRDASTSEPIAGVRVRALTSRFEVTPGRPRTTPGPAVRLDAVDLSANVPVVHEGMFGLEATTDEDGFYRVCHVPERRRVTVVVLYDDAEAGGETVQIAEPGGVREHTIRVPRRRPPR